MLSLGRLRVHGICSGRLAHREELVARSNCKRSYLWWLRNLVCGDSTGSNGVGKDWVRLFSGLVWGIVYRQIHCMKSVQIQRFSGLYFPVLELNTEIYGANLHIQSKYRKIPTRKNSVVGLFYAVMWLGSTYYNFSYPTNMLNISSRRFDSAQYYLIYGGI